MNSLVVSTSVRSGRNRSRTCARRSSRLAAAAAAASSSTLSTVRRAPAVIARTISASGLVDPLTEISSAGVPASSAISSSYVPNTSQPAPSSFRMRRNAMVGLALSETSTRVGPWGQASCRAVRQARTFARKAASEVT